MLHQQLQESEEIADGAYGDNPMVRGLARDQAVDLREQIASLKDANGANLAAADH